MSIGTVATTIMIIGTICGEVVSRDAEWVCGQVLTMRDRIDYLAVEYQIAHGRGRNAKTEGLSFHRILVSGRKRFVHNWHEYDDVPITLDDNHHMALFDGSVLKVLFVAPRYLEVFTQSAMAASKEVRMPAYIQAIGWWPSGDTGETPKGIGGASVLLHEAFSDGRFALAERHEVFDGDACYILKDAAGAEIWVDSAHGFVPRRRRLPISEPSGAAIVWEMHDIRQVSDGVWLPFSIVEEIVSPDGLRLGEGDQRARVFTVTSLRVNDPRADDFTIELRPGTLVMERDTGARWQVPGGLDFFDDICEQVAIQNMYLAAHEQAVNRVKARRVVGEISGEDFWALLACSVIWGSNVCAIGRLRRSRSRE